MKKSPKSFRELPPIRVRREPPTLDEAVAAAQDLADDVDQQTEIAAGLIGLPPEAVRAQVEAAFKLRAERGQPEYGQNRVLQDRVLHDRIVQERVVNAGSPSRPPRTVVVERRTRPPVVVERRGRPFEPRR